MTFYCIYYQASSNKKEAAYGCPYNCVPEAITVNQHNWNTPKLSPYTLNIFSLKLKSDFDWMFMC